MAANGNFAVVADFDSNAESWDDHGIYTMNGSEKGEVNVNTKLVCIQRRIH
jgi:hypothetical protein